MFDSQSKQSPLPNKGELAKDALLSAGMEEFGLRSLAGARTREIARKAGQNIAAINYYFGGKEGLYRAIAEGLVSYMSANVKPLIREAEALLASEEASREATISLIHRIFDTLVVALIANEKKTLPASMLIIREQMRPTAVFDTMFIKFLQPTQEIICRLLEHALGWPAEEEYTIVKVHSMMGQVFGFRAARETILRRANWDKIDSQEAQIIRQVIHDNIDALLSVTPPTGKPQ